MIKGVNKRIIEIVNPSDEYFEKIVIFLSPKVDENLQVINRRATKYVDNLCAKKSKRKPKTLVMQIAKLIFPAIFGGIVTSIFLLL